MRKGRACEAHGGKCQVADGARPWLKFEFFKSVGNSYQMTLYLQCVVSNGEFTVVHITDPHDGFGNGKK